MADEKKDPQQPEGLDDRIFLKQALTDRSTGTLVAELVRWRSPGVIELRATVYAGFVDEGSEVLVNGPAGPMTLQDLRMAQLIGFIDNELRQFVQAKKREALGKRPAIVTPTGRPN